MRVLKWVLIVVAVLVVVGLVAYARGPEHQRGDETGAQGASPAAVAFADHSQGTGSLR